MSCAYGCTRWLVYVFNFWFALCGLGLLVGGILRLLKVKEVAPVLGQTSGIGPISLIVIGAIIFTIAFFGCCGAIRENHCMIVTFAMCLLTILIIQVAIAIYAFVQVKGLEPSEFEKVMREKYENYWDNKDHAREYINTMQSTLHCCGVESYKDFLTTYNESNRIPYSCCPHTMENDYHDCTRDYYEIGCNKLVVEITEYTGKIIGGIAIGVAGVELFGIIFALCLANSIKNSERRGYRV